MNLRFKTLLASSFATIALVSGLSVGLSYLVLQQISQAEINTMNQRLDQTMRSLVAGAEGRHSSDQAPPGEPPPPGQSATDFILVLDPAGNPAPVQPGGPIPSPQPPAPELQAILTQLPSHWTNLSPEVSWQLPPDLQVGLLSTPQGFLLLMQRSLPERPGFPPLRILSGQLLTQERLQILGGQNMLRLDLLSSDEIPLPMRSASHPVRRMIQNLSVQEARMLEQSRSSSVQSSRQPEYGDKFHAGYILLQDVAGKPIILRGFSPRPFSTQGEKGVKVLLLFLWVVGLTFGVGLNLLLDRWVLARISHLGRQLRSIKGDFKQTPTVSLAGQDELSGLAADINALLRRQDHYQRQLKVAKAEIEQANLELERLACTDGLTQVMNRRFFQTHLEDVWQAALQTAQPLALILCDVDFFKLYNDTYGHLAGDVCLQKVAKVMTQTLQGNPTAILARYGGEEFAVLLTNTTVAAALETAEQLRLAVLQLRLPHSGSKILDCVTLSLGVCSLIPQVNLSPRDLIAQADEQLYRAKAEGRNRAIAHCSDVYPWRASVG